MNIILHPDELFLKGANQRLFYSQLVKNLEVLFCGSRVERIESGLWMSGVEENELERLAKIPGIANLAVAEMGGNDISELKRCIMDHILCIKGLEKIKTFRITTSRSFKQYQLTSKQVENEIGEFVVKKSGWKVDLKNYDLKLNINIGNDYAIVFGDTIEGTGGLPTGCSGKVLCLLSGGIDSPVTAYKMMTRGAEIGLIHFQNQTSVTDEVSEKIFDLAKTLSQYQSEIQLFIVPFADCQKEIVMKIPADCRMLVTRRIFLKIASIIAKKYKYGALATGDSLGQVASQTVENLTAIYQAVEILKFSPLIGTNKKDIMNVARKIDTLEISNRPYEDCCSLFVAKHPQTKAKLNNILKMETRLNLPPLDKIHVKSYYISKI
jgi:thiamine biosynthesis protein ThiI